jgi:predicted RNase H-like HicB family nuclease
MQFSVVVIPGDEHGYYVTVPLLPGWFSQGETVAEALTNVREAIEGHVAALAGLDEEIPQQRETPQLFTVEVHPNVPETILAALQPRA